MSVYLDASVLVSLFVSDVFSDTADQLLRSLIEPMLISDFAVAEFTSGVAAHVRSRRIAAASARVIFADFDSWHPRGPAHLAVTSDDVANAADLIRQLELPLRTPDAIHIAIARRLDAELLTFDKQMAKAARALGLRTAKT